MESNGKKALEGKLRKTRKDWNAKFTIHFVTLNRRGRYISEANEWISKKINNLKNKAEAF